MWHLSLFFSVYFIHHQHEKTISDLPASFVGGRVRPCCLFADPFSSPIASFGTASKTGSEAIPMAPLKQHERFTLDDGPRSEIYEGGLKAIRKKYGIHSLLQGLETGIHEVLYSYRFAPWRIVPEFYHLQPRDGAPLVEKPRRGIGEPFHYPTFWRTVGESCFLHFFPFVVDLLIVGFVFRLVAKKMLMIPRRFRGVHFLMSKEVVILRGFLLQFSMMNISRLGHKEGAIPPGNMIGDVLLVRVSSRWELMKEWLERRMEHWDPSEEYSQYLFWSAEPTRLADPSLRVGHESAVESRVSAGPPF
uniref:Uncharacterized protein n=1 Tax=Brassica campestris TaxID=3711 RepID=A0A3P6AAH1_BRACM|nr:unnamed protein product [Brassica rapa]